MISFVGIIISVGWWFVQHRAYVYVHRYNDLIKGIEGAMSMNPDYSISGIYDKLEKQEGPSVYNIVRTTARFSALAWIIGFLAFLGVCGV